MIIDFFIGLAMAAIGLLFGFEGNSLFIFLAAFILDFDIPVNELIRIFIKKEKKFSFTGFLDEKSYTHKFIFHLPLIVLPISFLVGMFYHGWLFGALLSLAIFLHLFHDTVDKNFDGVPWLWPFNQDSYKLKKFRLEVKSRKMLAEEAKMKKSRNTKEIFSDNKF